MVLIISSCATNVDSKEIVLYENYCASCHLAPKIESLPKHIWSENVLPEMGARMGIYTREKHPYKTLPFNEQAAIIKTGVYPPLPTIAAKDWAILQKYIISLAPDSLLNNQKSEKYHSLVQFKINTVAVDSVAGGLTTFLRYDTLQKVIHTGTVNGDLNSYDFRTGTNTLLGNFNNAISDARIVNDSIFVTSMGKLNPSEIPVGTIVKKVGNETALLADSIHRPVHTVYIDLDNNGTKEIIVSEYGDLRGKLSLFTKDSYGFYKKSVQFDLPGVIRVVPKDMNGDTKLDLVVMVAQGDESVYILYQEEALTFKMERVLRFSPVYGSSWMELVDYNGDGHDDIITVNGDNADKSFVNKPYHGMRIHINDGLNNFTEQFFFALNGATRVISKDFDKDGDIDIALLATFPDYENHADYNFVYLENINSENFYFRPQNLTDTSQGRWFLMDAADIDNDGDEDLVLSSFTYSFTPVPQELLDKWNTSATDLLILENNLY